MVLVQSQEASTPWAWKMFFWSFLTKTNQDQALFLLVASFWDTLYAFSVAELT